MCDSGSYKLARAVAVDPEKLRYALKSGVKQPSSIDPWHRPNLSLLGEGVVADSEIEMTLPDDMSAFKGKIDRQDQKISGLDAKLTGMLGEISTIQNDLRWHRIIGWGIAAA